jgi:hypothetical protein
MLGRLFGKNKDTSGEAVCVECGRTLLAGEWTETVEDDDGNERLLCSLCGQVQPLADDERLEDDDGRADAALLPSQVADDADDAAGQGTTERGENDALWKAIKDRDAQIERLKEQLARGEAERQELIARLAQSRVAASATADETPAAAVVPALTGEATRDEPRSETPAPDASAVEAPDKTEAHAAPEDTAEIAAADLPAEEPMSGEGTTEPAEAPTGAGEAEAQAGSMTLLQRGVDLLNVSPVPRKIAETNADLGIPSVHVGSDGETAMVTFMWSMGWYRFAVDVADGSVHLGARGYAERDDLQPNASVRADGTVQLAAATISRAAAQRQKGEVQDAAAAAADEAPAKGSPEKPADEAAPPAGGPEILSKSLLGQRTDDERPSWEGTQARDFDWDH